MPVRHNLRLLNLPVGSHALAGLGQPPKPLAVVPAKIDRRLEFVEPFDARLEVSPHRLALLVIAGPGAQRTEIPQISAADSQLGFPEGREVEESFSRRQVLHVAMRIKANLEAY